MATKHAVAGFTKSVALETAGSGVTSNAVCPGWVLTPLVAVQVEAKAKALNVSFDEAKVGRTPCCACMPSRVHTVPRRWCVAPCMFVVRRAYLMSHVCTHVSVAGTASEREAAVQAVRDS